MPGSPPTTSPASPASRWSTRRRFRENVVVARRLGYAHADQYLDFGLSGLALPLKDRKGHCQYALSVTVQRQVYPDTQLVDKLLPVLREVAEALRPII